jgi:hypothetical protein
MHLETRLAVADIVCAKQALGEEGGNLYQEKKR